MSGRTTSTGARTVTLGTKADRAAAARAREAIAAIEGGGDHHVLLGRTRIKLSNVDKVMYPQVGFTKLDVARWYMSIAPVVLRHLRGRPLTFKRYPDGVDGEFFYQKRVPAHAPDWVATTPRIGDQRVEYVLPDDVRTLLWAANLANLELHVLLARATQVQQPTVLAFDLDPGEGAGIVECCEVALIVRDLFAQLEMEAFPKTSGSKGMQVYVPLNDRSVTYEQTKPFAKAIAELLARTHPDLVVSKMLKKLRRGKVLVDWSQNDDHKTTVCVYSLRAKQRPTISTPLTWDEVAAARDAGEQDSLRFEPADVLERVDRLGDLFDPVLRLHQPLPDVF